MGKWLSPWPQQRTCELNVEASRCQKVRASSHTENADTRQAEACAFGVALTAKKESTCVSPDFTPHEVNS